MIYILILLLFVIDFALIYYIIDVKLFFQNYVERLVKQETKILDVLSNHLKDNFAHERNYDEIMK